MVPTVVSPGQRDSPLTECGQGRAAAARVQLLSEKLRESYVKHRQDPRYAATVAGRKVTVTPSESFAKDVERVIEEV